MNASKSATPAVEPLFLTDVQLAPHIGLSVSFLRKDRRNARVIPFLRTGADSRVLYDLESVRAALLALQVGGGRPQPRGNSRAGARS